MNYPEEPPHLATFSYRDKLHVIEKDLSIPPEYHDPKTGLAPVQLQVAHWPLDALYLSVYSGPADNYVTAPRLEKERTNVFYKVIGSLTFNHDTAVAESLAIGLAWLKANSTEVVDREPGEEELDRVRSYAPPQVVGFYWARGQEFGPANS